LRGQVLASERGQVPIKAQGLPWAAGQGTVEYLVIIAVVVVLSLVVVGIVVSQVGSGSSTSSTASEISSKTGLISITNASLNSQTGNYFLGIKNNDAESITVTRVQVGNDSNSFSQQLNMTSEKVFRVFTLSSCTVGQKTSASVTITYLTKYGLSKSQVVNDLGFSCENISVDATKLADYNSLNSVVLDVVAPVVTLVSPAPNVVFNPVDMNVNFVFNFDDAGSVSDCNLYVDDVLVDGNYSLMSNLVNVTLDGNLGLFGEGDYFWDVNCVDGSGNRGTATDRNVNYTIPYVSQFRNVYFGTSSDFNSGSYSTYATRFGSIKNFGQLDWNINDGTVRIDGLVAHYKMNDNAANKVVTDSVSRIDGNSSRNTSLLSTSSSRVGTGAFLFNGTSDDINVPLAVLPSGSTSRTFAFWFKTTSTRRETLFEYGSYNAGNETWSDMEYGYPSAGDLGWYRFGDDFTASGTNIHDGAWHWIVFKFDNTGSGTSNIWVDNVKRSADKTGMINTPVPGNNYPAIGFLRFNRLTGTMDDFRIYSKALSTDEMTAIFNSTSGTEQNGRGNWTDNNLVAYYKFDSKNGTTVFDSARGNTGTLTNGADTNAQGLWDTNAGYFDGVNDYVSSTGANLAMTGSLTISAWVKLNGTPAAYSEVATKIDNSTHGYALIVSNDRKAYFYIGDGVDWQTAVSTNTLQDNRWYYLTGVYSNGTINIFIDGVSAGPGVSQSSIGAWGTPYSFYIGNWMNGDRPYKGSIDEVKIYDRALSATEIALDYNRGLMDSNYVSRIIDTNLGTMNPVGTDFNYLVLNSNNGLDKNGHIYGTQIEPTIEKDLNNGLVGLWHLNEANGTTANDSSVYANNGTYANSPTVATGLWNTNARTFNGSNQYVTVPNSTSLNPSSITVAGWVKTNTLGEVGEFLTKRADSDYGAWNLYAGSYSGDGNFEVSVYGASCAFSGRTQLNSKIKAIAGKWYHVAFTVSSTTLSIYVDGVLANTVAYASGVCAGRTDAVRLGVGCCSRYLNGTLDEVAIWNRALDSNEVKEIFNKGASRIGAKYRGCVDSTCSANPAWSSLTYPDSNSRINLDSIDGSRYLQYALYPQLYQFPDGNYFPQAFATIRDVNLVYTN
jgi:hypothetical protein